MKKIVIVLIGIMLLPLIVNAAVDENTQITSWEVSTFSNASELCAAEEAKNISSELSNATSGYYLYCVKVACTNGVNVHTIDNPPSSKIKCANGNTNPYVEISNSGAEDTSLREGSACSQSGTYLYATEKMFYNCAKTSNGTSEGADFVSDDDKTADKADNNTTDKSPNTGVEDYIIGLTGAAVAIGISLYFINKKNMFKEI